MDHRWKGAVHRKTGARPTMQDGRVCNTWIIDGRVRFTARQAHVPRCKMGGFAIHGSPMEGCGSPRDERTSHGARWEGLQYMDHRWKGAVHRETSASTTV
jgi:hypothetical protein